LKAVAFGQNAGGKANEFGARLSQSVHTAALSQRWHASIACANCDTPCGHAAGIVETPIRAVIAAMLDT
jgi:hypothetical protein